ncbi:MAG: chaperone modulator CbpM [Gammaproteobacteria bacterium]|nr:chaperone modulator CbpM [Gammaproteobacteria bacterium]
MSPKTHAHSPEILSDSVGYNLQEFCELCVADAQRVVEMVELGVLEPAGENQNEWRFSAYSIMRFQKAQRLQHDLEIDLPGVALSLDLLESIESLQKQVRSLQEQIRQLLGSK